MEYLSDSLLQETYEKAKELQLHVDFIQIIILEIERRNVEQQLKE